MIVPPSPPGPTTVTLLISSTANDQFSQFLITVASITLTNKAGTSVTLFTNPMAANPTQYAEFIHLNADSESLVTISVPQDEYTSATVSGAFTTNGNFAAYNVTLAPYDLISQLTGATTIVVYTDTNTRMLNSTAIVPGRLLRFNGLLSNDNGTLRFVSDQVNDGVTQ